MKDVELKPITTEELLNKFDQWSDERLNWNYDKYAHERALWQMLKINEEHIKGLIEEDPTGDWCSAIVYDNVPGSYISSGDELDKIENYTETRECIIEMKRRAKLLNLI